MENIKEFIQENRKKGYSDAEIKSHLIQNSVSSQQADVVFCQIPNKNLISQIKKMISQGISLQQIKSSLRQQGLGDAYISLLLSKAFGSSKSHLPYVFAASVFVLILISFLLFLFLRNSSSQQVLSVHASSNSKSVLPGENLFFVVDTSIFGSKENREVFFTYRIIGTNHSKTERTSVQSFVSKTASINIPKDMPSANYDLEVQAQLNGDFAKTTFTFFVFPKTEPSEPLDVLDDSDDQIAPIIDFIEKDSEPNSVCIESWLCDSFPSTCPESGIRNRSCRDVNKCGTFENQPPLYQECSQQSSSCDNLPGKLRENCIAKEAKDNNDPGLCTTISNTADCFSGVAVSQNSTEMCFYISDISSRDSCLLKVAAQGNPGACDSIYTGVIRQACREATS
jgi:hypothetical protein